MAGDDEELFYGVEAGTCCKLRCNVGKPDLNQMIDYNLSWRQRIAPTHFDARLPPNADAAGDIAAAHTSSKSFRKLHEPAPR